VNGNGQEKKKINYAIKRMRYLVPIDLDNPFFPLTRTLWGRAEMNVGILRKILGRQPARSSVMS